MKIRSLLIAVAKIVALLFVLWISAESIFQCVMIYEESVAYSKLYSEYRSRHVPNTVEKLVHFKIDDPAFYWNNADHWSNAFTESHPATWKSLTAFRQLPCSEYSTNDAVFLTNGYTAVTCGNWYSNVALPLEARKAYLFALIYFQPRYGKQFWGGYKSSLTETIFETVSIKQRNNMSDRWERQLAQFEDSYKAQVCKTLGTEAFDREYVGNIVAKCCAGVGDTYLDEGALGKAKMWYQKALSIYDEIKIQGGYQRASTCLSLAMCEANLGQPNAAKALVAEAQSCLDGLNPNRQELKGHFVAYSDDLGGHQEYAAEPTTVVVPEQAARRSNLDEQVAIDALKGQINLITGNYKGYSDSYQKCLLSLRSDPTGYAYTSNVCLIRRRLASALRLTGDSAGAENADAEAALDGHFAGDKLAGSTFRDKAFSVRLSPFESFEEEIADQSINFEVEQKRQSELTGAQK